MKYRAGERRTAVEYEKAIAKWWHDDNTFEKSIENRPIDKSYVFYDGPPFITGNPHHGTLLSSIVKDAVPRFWTMRGYRVERKWGWDCHGLPAENFVEKQLGITDRRDIGTKWSLEDYIIKARESMVANSETWRSTIDRIGRWVDFDHAYRTMNKDFMESVWWAFKQLYDAGKIYEGRKVLMYDTKFATPVSKAEVTMDNDAYQTVTDPSAYVKFEIVGGAHDGEKYVSALGLSEEAGATEGDAPEVRRASSASGDDGEASDHAYFLAWTTTPWTLMANRALAVNPKMHYAKVKLNDEIYIVAESKIEKIFADAKTPYEILATKIPGAELASTTYTSIDGTICQVFAADFVGEEEGTGIVHCAPAYGEDDYALYQQHQDEIGFTDVLDENGYYLPEAAKKLHTLGVKDTDEYGIQIWAANKFIAKCLEAKGVVYKIEYIQHEYPFNPRSKERIMYRAFPSWFFDVENSKPLMLEENENINWFPSYLKHGRFMKNIEQAPDWNLSRDRFWATAMPVWKGEKTGAIKVFGSYQELLEYSGRTLPDYHRPWVDEIEFDAYVEDGRVTPSKGDPRDVLVGEETAAGPAHPGAQLEHFKRIEKVLDCWFESGSMPFAQLHYPFENKEKFEGNYPADFIVEYVGQVRAWFYYVHTVNTALASIGAFGKQAQNGPKNAFKNVITTGTLAGNDGRKMSKSLGNFTDPNELMDQYSADALRFLLLSSPVLSGEDFALLDKDVSDIYRKLNMLWNVYDFFTTYAEIDGWGNDQVYGLADSVLDSRSERSMGLENGAILSRKPITPNAIGDTKVQESSNGEMLAQTAISKSTISSPSENPLDVWIISRVYQLRDEITEGMEEYNLPKALAGVVPFIEDLSNWYVRRSRRRFSKNADTADKQSAYATLYYTLVYLTQLLAPFTPFLAEELYQKLTGDTTSVHLKDWPEPGVIDTDILDNMSRTREIITDALALRMRKSDTEDQIKVRQPLSQLTYPGDRLDQFYEQIIMDEVNVKAVATGPSLMLNKEITPELKAEGEARELIRAIQSARKKAGLQMNDHIKLTLSADIPEGYEGLIKSETLTDSITKVAGEDVITVEKV